MGINEKKKNIKCGTFENRYLCNEKESEVATQNIEKKDESKGLKKNSIGIS